LGFKVLVFTTIIIFILGCSKAEVSSNNQIPNILILIADDASYRDFGCYGNEVINTPNIDNLAEEGLKFNNAFLTTAQCSPSRISILSGQYPHSTGAEDLHMPLPDGINLLPNYLKKKNYFSGLLKKSHLGQNGEKQFDYYSKNLDDFNLFLDSATTRPFFMWVGFSDPHRPYEKGIIENSQDFNEVYVPSYFVDDKNTRIDLADYYNEIMRMDRRIGEYTAILKERDLYENTIIVFLTDNGAPFPREKGSVYDAGVKTPLLFTWRTQIAENTNFYGLASVIDLAPTILDICGISIPKSMQGNSIYEVLKNPDLPGREYIFSERNWHNCDEHIRSVRSESYKLISNSYTDLPHGTAADISNSPTWVSLKNKRDKKNLTREQGLLFQYPRSEFEFYDLNKDPLELNNVINDENYQEQINSLKNILNNWQINTSDFPPTERRRKDNTDRFNGVKFDQTRLPPRI